jgi:rRNA maturation endonuclease Nob1
MTRKTIEEKTLRKLINKISNWSIPLWHCQKCHHEWEEFDQRNCDWCGGESYLLTENG